MEKQPININLDPNIYAVSNAKVVIAEEEVQILLVSGHQGRQFMFTPKHAKRLMLLLAENIQNYEEKFGELKTELPKQKGNSGKKKSVGF